ncbi:MAG: hypothetical protein ACOX44_10125 [Limnochordia bacterium]
MTKAGKHKDEACEFVRWSNSQGKSTLTDATSLPPITYAGVRDDYKKLKKRCRMPKHRQGSNGLAIAILRGELLP